MNDDREWIGRTQGRLKIHALIRPSTQGRAALYRAACSCGQHIAISRTALVEGAEDCGCGGEQRQLSEPIMSYSYGANVHVPENVFLCYCSLSGFCPKWWQTSLKVAIEGICNMLARDEYTHGFVAEWWECPVEFVECVSLALKDRIRRLRNELVDLSRIYESIIDERLDTELPNGSYEGITSLMAALSHNSRAGRYSRRLSAE